MPRNSNKIDYSAKFSEGFEIFSEISDPRGDGNTRHHFGEIVFMAFTCIVCGVKSYGIQVPAGNVTIPPNHAIPQMGTVIEVRYLYAHRESGSIYQPVYLGERHDIPAEDCTVDQLKFKSEPAASLAD